MFFKLSLKNIKKSFKDYSIYFLTLIFGVAIFYIFNSIDSQTAMLNISETKMSMIQVIVQVMGYLSIFISFILGFLIVYANNFLIKRRKKEFGIYMTLGMGKGKISKLLLVETIVVGILSLAIGLLVGVFASQFMSVFVAKLFEINMTSFVFVFSGAALLKTVIYFGVIYLFVMIFNTFAISKCKLIDLLNASKKTEKIKVKNPILSILLFILSIASLGSAYWMVIFKQDVFLPIIWLPIILGTVGTFLFFASLSGLILRLVQSNKKLYYKNLNTFVLRQINSKINTTIVSMSIICLMLFLTICILSSAWTLNDTTNRQMRQLTPVDVSIEKYNNMDDVEDVHGIKDKNIVEVLKQYNYDMTKYEEILEIPTYESDEVTQEVFFGPLLDEITQKYKYVKWNLNEQIMTVSDYNKIAKMYGIQTIDLKENQYTVVCNNDTLKQYRDRILEMGSNLNINGVTYSPSTDKTIDGFIRIAPSPMNAGIIILPDSAKEDLQINTYVFNAKYNDSITEDQKYDLENELSLIYDDLRSQIYSLTKQEIYDSNIALTAMITFIGLYLGIIFLITSAAILALKELSESSDNKERYSILRKIGADEKMINHSLFAQIGIFFMFPLLLSIIHSIVGLSFANSILSMFGKSDIFPSIVITALFIIVIYGGYFIATYFGSKAIIKENDR